MATYMRIPKRNYYNKYKEAFEDLEIGKTETVLFAEEVGKQKTQALRRRWSAIARHPLTDEEMKILTRLMISPRNDLSIREDGTLFRRTMEMGEGTITSPIHGSIE